MPPPVRDRFCNACGTAYAEPLKYPRKCANEACGLEVWANPIPVCVVLLPVRNIAGAVGLLVVRRSIEPRKGFLALVGGFIEEHETWQQAGAREVREESDVVIDPAGIKPLWFTSTEPRPNRVLLFCEAQPIERAALPAFSPTNESDERGLVFGPDGLESVFAFPLHARAARQWFEAKGIAGPHRYERA